MDNENKIKKKKKKKKKMGRRRGDRWTKIIKTTQHQTRRERERKVTTKDKENKTINYNTLNHTRKGYVYKQKNI